jgi:topoisomerase-4 subunit A
LLVFPVADVPELDKGRGNKLFGLPPARGGLVDETLMGVAVVPEGGKLYVQCGERRMTLTFNELREYHGERGQRGGLLPRGWRTVSYLEV